MKKKLFKILNITFLMCLYGTVLAQTGNRPNVVLINFDDMGYGDTEPYGMTGISTPNINQVAQEGMRFTHFNATQPVCSASRASLLTGCYSNRVGISGALMPNSPTALNPDEQTIASLLKEAGYKTAMLGKWHLGDQAPYLPPSYGFDSFLGLPYSNDMWPNDFDGNPVGEDHRKFGRVPLVILDGVTPIDTVKTLEDQSNLTAFFTNKAVSYIQSNYDEPFFLYLAHPMPHVPIGASDKFRGKSELGLFGDVIMELDWSVGEIVKALDEAGVSENTLLIITSDNGPWKSYGNHAGSTAGLREGKNTTMDGGTRVPLFVKWPRGIEAGTVNSSLLANMDILPTIVEATGASLPEKPIDGLSFFPVLKGEAKQASREILYYYFGYGKGDLEAIRYKNWKLVLPHQGTNYGTPLGMNGFPGTMNKIDLPMSLYNLSFDPGESYDVQEQYPEIIEKLLGIAEQSA